MVIVIQNFCVHLSEKRVFRLAIKHVLQKEQTAYGNRVIST